MDMNLNISKAKPMGEKEYAKEKLRHQSLNRIISLEEKSKSYEDFTKKMTIRLKRIQNLEKIKISSTLLRMLGHHEIANVYDSKILIDEIK